MTYARKKAHEAQDRWLNGPGGHAEALEAVEAVVASVVEDCAREAEKQIADDDGDPASEFSRGYKEGCLSSRDAINAMTRTLSPDTKGQP